MFVPAVGWLLGSWSSWNQAARPQNSNLLCNYQEIMRPASWIIPEKPECPQEQWQLLRVNGQPHRLQGHLQSKDLSSPTPQGLQVVSGTLQVHLTWPAGPLRPTPVSLLMPPLCKACYLALPKLSHLDRQLVFTVLSFMQKQGGFFLCPPVSSWDPGSIHLVESPAYGSCLLVAEEREEVAGRQFPQKKRRRSCMIIYTHVLKVQTWSHDHS